MAPVGGRYALRCAMPVSGGAAARVGGEGAGGGGEGGVSATG